MGNDEQENLYAHPTKLQNKRVVSKYDKINMALMVILSPFLAFIWLRDKAEVLWRKITGK